MRIHLIRHRIHMVTMDTANITIDCDGHKCCTRAVVVFETQHMGQDPN